MDASSLVNIVESGCDVLNGAGNSIQVRPLLTRFGKPVGPLLRHKSAFFEDNDALLARQMEMAQLYGRQPQRSHCMTCTGRLPAEPLFIKLGIPYFLCDVCGHLNGGHIDTDEFCRSVYTETGGSAYASFYAVEHKAAYAARVGDIYTPKAEFLLDGLRLDGTDPAALSFADVGAGSGYMVAALHDVGIDRVTGYEVSEVQVQMARTMRPEASMVLHRLEDVYKIAGSVDADVVSMIGVLEHLQKPIEILQALGDNQAVRYVFISVPLFSLSAVLILISTRINR